MKNYWLDNKDIKDYSILTNLFELVKKFGIDRIKSFSSYELEVFERFLDRIYEIDKNVYN